jgi:DNA-binding CsgD family transcriptional regulator
MAHAEKTVVINRPVESVFDFVLNGANNKLWRSSVLDVRALSEAPYGSGSKFEQGLKGSTGRIPGDYEITECNPYDLIRFRVTAGPARPTGIYRFQRQDGATAVTLVLDYEPNGLSRQMDPTITQQVLQEARQAENEAGSAAIARLSPPERRLLQMASEGRSEHEMAQALSLGEGTVHNTVFSVLSKVLEPVIQRSMNAEVGMLDELKSFLEKHV